jgi:hypothetical protein
MRRQWTVRRGERPTPDGQHRWDRAYQHLLAWTTRQPLEEVPDEKLACQPPALEVNQESRPVCESLHPTPSADTEP